MTAPTGPVDFRFHLPPGPPLPPKSWQQRNRWLIRTGTVVAVVVMVALGVTALVRGYQERSTITAMGAVTVDCGTRAAVGSAQIAYGDIVELYDADDSGAGPLATTRLTGLHRLAGGACLAEFEVDDVKTVDVYVVRIGEHYRGLVTAAALSAGYLFA